MERSNFYAIIREMGIERLDGALQAILLVRCGFSIDEVERAIKDEIERQREDYICSVFDTVNFN